MSIPGIQVDEDRECTVGVQIKLGTWREFLYIGKLTSFGTCFYLFILLGDISVVGRSC